MKTGTMRLMIAEYNCSTGTETVSLGIIPELLHLVECVVWALPPHRTEFYKKLLPPSDRLIYEDIYWPQPSGFLWRAHGLLRRLDLLFPRSHAVAWLRSQLITSRIKQLIQKHAITHFFTTWIFNVNFPMLPIPIGAMAMDLNWRHFPENFPEDSQENLDRLFEEWMARSRVVFPISNYTANEMRQAFPRSSQHLKTVPHGAQALSATKSSAFPAPPREASPRKYFYYPASALQHKDHRTLVEAAVELYSRGYDFDLVCSGGRTECFQTRDVELSNDWTESIRALLAKHAAVINGRVKMLGTLDRSKVDELFDGACAIVLPSRFEGFGLPLLEAIERGGRVICTDIPPFQEQIDRYDYADYATTYPVGAAVPLAKLMEAALKSPIDERLRPEEITERTQRWTWKDAAAAYVDALQNTGDRPS